MGSQEMALDKKNMRGDLSDAHYHGTDATVDHPQPGELLGPLQPDQPSPRHREVDQVGDAKPYLVVAERLPHLPLHAQHHRRAAPVRRPRLLPGLVELSQLLQVLAKLELACSSLVSETPVQTSPSRRLVPKLGDHHRVPGVLLLPRVHCLGAFENAQALALHRFHAQRSLGASERLARGTVWTKSCNSQYVAFHCRGAASTGYDLLSRLCRRAPRICASLTSKFCAS